MSENTVAIRCKSEMNRWMDSVMVVPQEQADDIEQSIKSGCVASSATAPAMET